MGPRHSLTALLIATACQDGPASHSSFGSSPGVTTTSVSSSSGGSGAAGSSSGTTASSSSDAVSGTGSGSDGAAETAASTFDLGVDVDFGGAPVGCKGKIDFLFVISRSGLMKDLQDRLIAAFPAFIATIEEKFADFDYHIMVVDGDADWGLSYCTEECPKPFEKMCTIEDYPCDLLDTVTECDNKIGAGSVFPAGGLASNKPCAIDGGRRFLTREQADLKETFTCIAQLGMSGRSWIGDALTAAVSPQLNNGKAACNYGFLRNDALLMVTMISDGYEEGHGNPLDSNGTPEEWAQAVIDAKKGDPESIVMLSILDPSCPPYDGLCKMVNMFPYKHIGAGWDLDYGLIFEEATELVEVACEGFSPPPG